MGFLDDIKKNVENAVEGVKSNVEDMLHRPHPEHAQADQAPQEQAPHAAAPGGAPGDAHAPAAAAVEDPAEAVVAEHQSTAPAPQASADEEWPEPAPEADPAVGATSEAGAAPETGSDHAASQEIVVEAGDTMAGIAAQFGVDVDALIDANRDTVPDPDLIRPGQILRLP